MVLKHDFDNFPELTNAQMDESYWESPHKQILSDFKARCVKVHDGDTITVQWDERDFTFPIRFLNVNAPELSEGGRESQQWLEGQILNQEIEIKINPNNRVGRYGRLLGHVFFQGLNMGETMLHLGLTKEFANRDEGKLPNLDKELKVVLE